MDIFDKVLAEIEKQLKNDMLKAQDFAFNWIKSRTPEDTTKLVNSYQKTPPKITNKDISASVITKDTDYSLYVEYWVKNKRYKYNKPKWTIFREWVGARMFQLTKEQDGEKIYNLLKKNSKIIIKWNSLTLQK